jgi:hypothetical protein
MLTSDQEIRLIILLSIMDLGGKGTKAQVLDNIVSKNYWSFSEYDTEVLQTREEERWRNKFAFVRDDLKNEGYLDGSIRNIWALTSSSESYAKKLVSILKASGRTRKLKETGARRALLLISGESGKEEVEIIKVAEEDRPEYLTSDTQFDATVTSDDKESEKIFPQSLFVEVESSQIEQDIERKESRYSANGVFDPKNARDARERIIGSIVRRRGQPQFRKLLLVLYKGRCAITGSDVEQALEGAHITPYKGEETNHPTNGLLLRADVHTLFDLGLLTISSRDMTVIISRKLMGTTYDCLNGRSLILPDEEKYWPSRDALDMHREGSNL